MSQSHLTQTSQSILVPPQPSDLIWPVMVSPDQRHRNQHLFFRCMRRGQWATLVTMNISFTMPLPDQLSMWMGSAMGARSAEKYKQTILLSHGFEAIYVAFHICVQTLEGGASLPQVAPRLQLYQNQWFWPHQRLVWQCHGVKNLLSVSTCINFVLEHCEKKKGLKCCSGVSDLCWYLKHHK